MTEEEFDSLMRAARPFGSEDARQMEARMLRSTALLTTLGAALWGKTNDDLRRQLLRPYPAIPPGCGVRDLHDLLQVSGLMVSAIAAAYKMGLPHAFDTSPAIVVHAQSTQRGKRVVKSSAARSSIWKKAEGA
jgi:hypothetical protein